MRRFGLLRRKRNALAVRPPRPGVRLVQQQAARALITAGAVAAAGVMWACGFDDALREYLSAYFWLPFAKGPVAFERPGVRRISFPFAGMQAAAGDSPLSKLRAAYQEISEPTGFPFDPSSQRQLVAAARADPSLSGYEQEEIDLIDAKIEMRAGEPDNRERLNSARSKLEAFLQRARSPAFRSEARMACARALFAERPDRRWKNPSR